MSCTMIVVYRPRTDWPDRSGTSTRVSSCVVLSTCCAARLVLRLADSMTLAAASRSRRRASSQRLAYDSPNVPNFCTPFALARR
eukprot:3801376-Prymnesium_polylepis.2